MAAGNHIIGSPGNSPALKYEMQLVQSVYINGTKEITADRIDLCFSILDDLIPKFGVYQRVMKHLRDELLLAVFSDEYTVGGSKKKKSDDKPSRIPHFTIAKRCMEERDKQVAKLKSQIHFLKEQLYTCEADLEKTSSVVEGYRYDTKESETKLRDLTLDFQTVVKERDKLKQLASLQEGIQDGLKQEAKDRLTKLQDTIASQDMSINELKNYKSTYDKLQKTFSSFKGYTSTNNDSPTITLKSSLERELSVINTMEYQLLEIQNKLIEQHESFLFTFSNEKNKLKTQREKFKMSIEEIDKEISLLRSYHGSLSTRKEQLSTLDPLLSHQAIVMSHHPASPLVTQEQTLNKYAAMLYTSSDNELSYYPVKEGKECLSCGDKVVVCPHWSSNELVIQLPLHTTHIKLTRPPLYTTATPTTAPINQTDVQKRDKLRPAPDSILDPDINKIWNHFNTKYDVHRRVPRQLSLEFLLSTMSFFYATELKLDEAPSTDSTHSIPLLSSFYKFMISRYHIKHVALLVIHDCITSLNEHYPNNTNLLIFAHVLGGTTDGVLFRYQLLLADLIDLLPWRSIEEFTKWAALVYPFLQEEELEHLTIDYIGHSSNTINKYTVMNYITWLLLKHREPMILQAESQLSEQNTTDTDSMSDAEFAEVCLSLCSSGDSLVMRLYSQSISQLTEGQSETPSKISIRQLSYILGYIQLLTSFNSIQEKLKDLVTNLPGIEYLESTNKTELLKLTSIKKMMS